ncbi:MAG TPA: DUF2911 domain-containing protein [Acidobacteriota bacterium]|nr:DUF2911 domain-containing protein [Acidobacteriota bacterium]
MLKHLTVWTAILFLFAVEAQAQVKQGQWTPSVENSTRGYCSIAYWTYRDDGVEISGGRVTLGYGRPAWRPQWNQDAAFDSLTKGRIWRLGKDMWTSLDSQLDLEMGGRKVAAGYYYLGARRRQQGDWSLVFVDPEAVRPGYIDAWAFVPRADEVPILFEVPLEHSRSEASATELKMTLQLQGAKDQGLLSIQWGPHLLRASFKLDVPAPDFYKEQP